MKRNRDSKSCFCVHLDPSAYTDRAWVPLLHKLLRKGQEPSGSSAHNKSLHCIACDTAAAATADVKTGCGHAIVLDLHRLELYCRECSDYVYLQQFDDAVVLMSQQFMQQQEQQQQQQNNSNANRLPEGDPGPDLQAKRQRLAAAAAAAASTPNGQGTGSQQQQHKGGSSSHAATAALAEQAAAGGGCDLAALASLSGACGQLAAADGFPLGLRGLNNLGNTCFMNSVLQVMFHAPLLPAFYLGEGHDPSACRLTARDKPCLSCQMESVFGEVYSGNRQPFSPAEFLYQWWRFADSLAGYQMQDAHEFFLSLLEGLSGSLVPLPELEAEPAAAAAGPSAAAAVNAGAAASTGQHDSQVQQQQQALMFPHGGQAFAALQQQQKQQQQQQLGFVNGQAGFLQQHAAGAMLGLDVLGGSMGFNAAAAAGAQQLAGWQQHGILGGNSGDAVNGWGQAQQQQQHSGLAAGGGALSGYETPASSGATPEPEGEAEAASQPQQPAAGLVELVFSGLLRSDATPPLLLASPSVTPPPSELLAEHWDANDDTAAGKIRLDSQAGGMQLSGLGPGAGCSQATSASGLNSKPLSDMLGRGGQAGEGLTGLTGLTGCTELSPEPEADGEEVQGGNSLAAEAAAGVGACVGGAKGGSGSKAGGGSKAARSAAAPKQPRQTRCGKCKYCLNKHLKKGCEANKKLREEQKQAAIAVLQQERAAAAAAEAAAAVADPAAAAAAPAGAGKAGGAKKGSGASGSTAGVKKQPPPAPILRMNELSLAGCLRRFVRPETLGPAAHWHCSACGSRQAALKQMSIRRLPLVLCFHVKRFEHGGGTQRPKKLDVPMRFPLQGLDMAPFTTSEVLRSRAGGSRCSSSACAADDAAAGNAAAAAGSGEPPDTQQQAAEQSAAAAGQPVSFQQQGLYELFGVVSHNGDMASGHYVSYVKCEGSWYLVNDPWVVAVSEADVAAVQAYMLFYAQEYLFGSGSSSSVLGKQLVAAAAELAAAAAAAGKQQQGPAVGVKAEPAAAVVKLEAAAAVQFGVDGLMPALSLGALVPGGAAAAAAAGGVPGCGDDEGQLLVGGLGLLEEQASAAGLDLAQL
ncbi:hypothetical protein OEZ85_011908 [Tetradesmus obliquus]|uniref:ubiquitinyl hydrolase 1 n=1 Tax=Tetradesmus obliquus TaxID=3088 RepID=A0ABY8TRQ6_TETOB|nr:hypothetical protein OEZ85_011908 [Tetradesmus obliquus]